MLLLPGNHLLGEDPREFVNSYSIKMSSVWPGLEAGGRGQGFPPHKITKVNTSPFNYLHLLGPFQVANESLLPTPSLSPPDSTATPPAPLAQVPLHTSAHHAAALVCRRAEDVSLLTDDLWVSHITNNLQLLPPPESGAEGGCPPTSTEGKVMGREGEG